MHRAGSILIAATAAVLAGCHTASGRAVESRIGGSLGELWRNTTGLLSGEIGRSNKILRDPRYRSWQPQTRLAALVSGSRETAARVTARTSRLPGLLAGLPIDAVRDGIQRVRSLARRESRPVREHQPGPLLGRLSGAIENFTGHWEFARPILGGPGDPDRSIDPDAVRRQETWVERLLRRL